MLFKPFQPPSRKKSQPDSSDNPQPAKRRRVSGDEDETTKKEGRPSFAELASEAKRRRVSGVADGIEKKEGSRSFAQLASEAIKAHRASKSDIGPRKPLVPVRNSTNSGSSQNDDGVEGFYNVLWYASLLESERVS